MRNRFQIEDLTAQGAWGVVFRAVDVESGAVVAVRRFFPFGIESGGLQEDERESYRLAVERLAAVRHPALRSVVGGGCDPVDGMPYLATEWVAGGSLAERLAGGALEAGEAIALMGRVLEVCGALSGVLGEDACWVELEPASILAGEGGRGFTFGICPMRWLGADVGGRGMEPLVALADAVMGWQGRVVGDTAGGGLGGWLKWLRMHAAAASVRDARQALSAATGGRVATPTERLDPAPVGPPPRVVMRPVVAPMAVPAGGVNRGWVVAAILAAVVVLAAVGWVVSGSGNGGSDGEMAVGAGPREQRSADEASERAAELSQRLAAGDVVDGDGQAGRLTAVRERGGHYLVGESDLMVLRKGERLVVEAVLVRIRPSGSGKTVYFEFSATPAADEVRGYFMTASAPEGVEAEVFETFVGKKVRLSGVVRVDPFSGGRRPELLIEDAGAVVPVP